MKGLGIRIPSDMLFDLKVMLASKGMTIQDFVSKLIMDDLEKDIDELRESALINRDAGKRKYFDKCVCFQGITVRVEKETHGRVKVMLIKSNQTLQDYLINSILDSLSEFNGNGEIKDGAEF